MVRYFFFVLLLVVVMCLLAILALTLPLGPVLVVVRMVFLSVWLLPWFRLRFSHCVPGCGGVPGDGGRAQSKSHNTKDEFAFSQVLSVWLLDLRVSCQHPFGEKNISSLARFGLGLHRVGLRGVV